METTEVRSSNLWVEDMILDMRKLKKMREEVNLFFDFLSILLHRVFTGHPFVERLVVERLENADILQVKVFADHTMVLRHIGEGRVKLLLLEGDCYGKEFLRSKQSQWSGDTIPGMDVVNVRARLPQVLRQVVFNVGVLVDEDLSEEVKKLHRSLSVR